jgi:uncharacterized protein YqgV (UPF0045/DUF77 family)
MKLTAEITLYPIQDDYLSIIKSCIAKMNSYSDLTIDTFATATIVHGQYQPVMSMINELIAWTYEQYGKSVFVVKFLPGHDYHS